MYLHVTHSEASKIEELGQEFESNFWRKKKIEESKVLSDSMELKYRQARVDWFKDAVEHGSMLDRARLLHKLPQLYTKKSGKRGWSRSRSRVGL